MSMATDPSVVNKYKAGFSECANEVGRFLGRVDGLDVKVKQHLMSHLANCITGVGGGNGGSTNQVVTSGHVVAATPVQVHLPTATISVIPQTTGNSNNNVSGDIPSNVFRGLQLVPTRLPSGDIAFVFPNTPTGTLTVQQPVTSPIEACVEVKSEPSSSPIQYHQVVDPKVSSCDSSSDAQSLSPQSFSPTQSLVKVMDHPITTTSVITSANSNLPPTTVSNGLSLIHCHSSTSIKLEPSSTVTGTSLTCPTNNMKTTTPSTISPALLAYSSSPSAVNFRETGTVTNLTVSSVALPVTLQSSSEISSVPYKITQQDKLRRAEVIVPTSLPPLKPFESLNEVSSTNNTIISNVSSSSYIGDKISTLAARTAVVAPVSVIPPPTSTALSPVYIETPTQPCSTEEKSSCGLDLRINQSSKQLQHVVYGGGSPSSSKVVYSDLKPTATVSPSMVSVSTSANEFHHAEQYFDNRFVMKAVKNDESDLHMWRPW